MMTHDCCYLGQWRGTIGGRVTWSKPSSWVHQFLLPLLSSTPSFLHHWSRSCFGITWPNTPLRAEFLSHSLNSHAQGHSECVTMLRQWRLFLQKNLFHITILSISLLNAYFTLKIKYQIFPSFPISPSFLKSHWNWIKITETSQNLYLTDKRNWICTTKFFFFFTFLPKKKVPQAAVSSLACSALLALRYRWAQIAREPGRWGLGVRNGQPVRAV